MRALYERPNLTAISGMVLQQSLLMIFRTFCVFDSVAHGGTLKVHKLQLKFPHV